MSSVLNRLRKRRGSPVVVNGETFYVRSLTIGDLRRLDAIGKAVTAADAPTNEASASLARDRRTALFYSLAICADESGEPAIPKLPDETDEQLADRVISDLDDVPTETLAALSEAVTRLGKLPTTEAITKN